MGRTTKPHRSTLAVQPPRWIVTQLGVDRAVVPYVEVDFLNMYGEWITPRYESAEYAEDYLHIAEETRREWAPKVAEWLADNLFVETELPAYVEHTAKLNWSNVDWCDAVAKEVAKQIDTFETVFEPNTYRDYGGEGLAVFSWELGEVEEEISVAECPDLAAIPAEDLEDCLEAARCDAVLLGKRGERLKSGYFTASYNLAGQHFMVVPESHLYKVAAIVLANKLTEQLEADRARRLDELED